jgi:membrane protein YdbS with pleckstrin-like domain
MLIDIDDYKYYERRAWIWATVLWFFAMGLELLAFYAFLEKSWVWMGIQLLLGSIMLWQSRVMLTHANYWRRRRKEIEQMDQNDEIQRS